MASEKDKNIFPSKNMCKKMRKREDSKLKRPEQQIEVENSGKSRGLDRMEMRTFLSRVSAVIKIDDEPFMSGSIPEYLIFSSFKKPSALF